MIELIYNEEEETSVGKETLEEPKNVRQIGEPREYKKIFIEDYVHTYLGQYEGSFAILLGSSRRSGGKRHLYITGALAIGRLEEKQGKYLFSEKLWSEIYRQCEDYFPGQEIIGWYLSCEGFVKGKLPVVEETHRTYFSGADKVLFVRDTSEGESFFFGFDGNRFAKQSGYYIYYEKNDPMREYILSKKGEEQKKPSGEKPDVAMANFRKILKEKKEQSIRRRQKAVTYGMKVTAVLVLFVAAVSLRNRVEPEKLFQKQAEDFSVEVAEAASDQVIIEELPGNVEEEVVSEEPVADLMEELPVTEETEEEQQQEEVPEEEGVEEIQEHKTEEAGAQVSRESYEVQPGDTLAAISRKIYGTDARIQEICELNDISNGDYIQAGEIILLP